MLIAFKIENSNVLYTDPYHSLKDVSANLVSKGYIEEMLRLHREVRLGDSEKYEKRSG